MKKVIVLMSTYNGECYLEEQLQSILNQKFQDDKYKLKILVRDDGSCDNTVSILEKYKKSGALNYYTGDNIGCEQSFWDLIKKSEDADYYAFSDQDDVWFEDKISRALEKLSDKEKEQGGENNPLLYASSVIPTDNNLSRLVNATVIKGKIYTDFPHSLLKNVVQGCTSVFNHEARKYLCMYDMKHNCLEMHDSLTFKIVALFGEVIYDEKPSMYYRQHDKNVVGVYKRGKLSPYKKIYNFLTNCNRQQSRIAKSLEHVYKCELDHHNKNWIYLYKIAHYRDSIRETMSLLSDKAYRTELSDDMKFFCRVICRRI